MSTTRSAAKASRHPTTGTRAPVLCDLDGVVWLAHHPIDGASGAIAALRAGGRRVLFVTNNSAPVVAEQVTALEHIGIPARGDVLTSGQAAALLLEPGARVLVCGGDGIVEAVRARSAVVVGHDEVDAGERVDAVVVGFHRDFDYERMRRASTAVRRGARLIGTNDDPTYPTPDGPIPGGGAILAAIATASGVVPEIAGKPYAPMAALVRTVLGVADLSDATPGFAMTDVVMIGDRPSTDGLFARTLGCRYAQVWSGVTPKGAVVDPPPDLVADSLVGLVPQLV